MSCQSANGHLLTTKNYDYSSEYEGDIMIYKVLEDNRVIAICRTLYETNKVIKALKFFQDYNDDEQEEQYTTENANDVIDSLFTS